MQSNKCANSLLLLGHTEATLRYVKAGMGEIAHAVRIRELLQESGIDVASCIDIFELFGGVEGLFQELSQMNVALAQAGQEVVSSMSYPELISIRERILFSSDCALWIISHLWSVAALLALGIQEKRPLAAKLFVHHSDEIVAKKLYEPVHLLVTESLLANQVAIESGIEPWKLFYLPHSYPPCADLGYRNKTKAPLESLAQRLGKTIDLRDKLVVGTASRLVMGKNVEYALHAVETLIEEGYPLIYVLKGAMARSNPYEEWLYEKINALKDKSWFFFDESRSTIEEMMALYNSWDIALQLSGAEAGSNTVVEEISLGLPTIVLNASTHPELFREGVHYVEKQPTPIAAPLLFYRPEVDSVIAVLRTLVSDSRLREELGQKARELACMRFAPHIARERLPLLVQTLYAYFEGNVAKERAQERLIRQYESDCRG